ncbi:MAG: N-acetylmuramoyl-L-alanine amidase family protein [Thermodesulfobacteriota bacterium]
MTNQNTGCKRRGLLLGAIVCCVLGFTLTTAVQVGQAAGGSQKPVVVIDPGHGGPDRGVSGPAGGAEKTVVFAIAQAVKKKLASACRVRLTRTGDYRVGVNERASIANHRQGDLFVSLHTGGSHRRAINNWTIYCRDRNQNSGPHLAHDAGPRRWHQLQNPHARDSAAFAETVKQHLQSGLDTEEIETTPAPLLVLSGVDMPAVMIETGDLTHPAQARALSGDAYRSDVADAIAGAVVAFLEKK